MRRSLIPLQMQTSMVECLLALKINFKAGVGITAWQTHRKQMNSKFSRNDGAAWRVVRKRRLGTGGFGFSRRRLGFRGDAGAAQWRLEASLIVRRATRVGF